MTTQAEKARKKGGGGRKQLPMAWRVTLYGSLFWLTGGRILYAVDAFKVRTLQDCKILPSDLDIFMQDSTTIAAILLIVAVIGGFYHLEN